MKQGSGQKKGNFHQHIKGRGLVFHYEFFPPFLTALCVLKEGNFKDSATNQNSTGKKRSYSQDVAGLLLTLKVSL